MPTPRLAGPQQSFFAFDLCSYRQSSLPVAALTAITWENGAERYITPSETMGEVWNVAASPVW
jgi:hypothetical protein